MKQILSRNILVLLFFCCLSVSIQADDFKVIKNRMDAEYSNNPSPSSVETVLNQMAEDGRFESIQYKSTDGSPRTHLLNLTTLACAYNSPENKYYKSDVVEAKYAAGLRFWVTTNHQATNWWYRYIAYPKELSKSVVLMSDQLSKDKDLFTNTMRYLRWSYENANPHHMTGANGCDIIMGSLVASVLTKNREQMLDFKKKMTELISIQETEGISPDYMYGQHCGTGRQLYMASYGKEYINSVLYYLDFCNKTEFATPGVALIEDFFINGVQWIFFSKNYDPNQSGRYDNSNRFYGQFQSMTNRVLKLNTPRKLEVKKVYDRIRGENSLVGNRMFWRFDYMIHRRTNYMVSSRMSSTRTVGAEAGNGDGEFNYYSGNGTNYLFVTGNEYGGAFFEHFNFRQFPGITAEQDDAVLPIPNWGEGGTNGNSFAGGVSDSTYGACGMILQRRGVTAYKSWFYFDDEIVCLGAGIHQSDGKASVYTTVNQCNAAGSVQYDGGDGVKTLKKNQTLVNPAWIFHDKIAYFNILPGSTFELACDTSLFSLNINHGVNPKEGTYAYIVKPGVPSVGDARAYVKNPPVLVLANRPSVQAVKNRNLNVTEVLFYEPGTVGIGDGKSITVDAPCALLWKEKTGAITLANPNCESANPKNIHVKVTINGQDKQLDFELPTGVQAGSSVTKILKY